MLQPRVEQCKSTWSLVKRYLDLGRVGFFVVFFVCLVFFYNISRTCVTLETGSQVLLHVVNHSWYLFSSGRETCGLIFPNAPCKKVLCSLP